MLVNEIRDLLFNETSEKNDLQLFATKLTEKPT